MLGHYDPTIEATDHGSGEEEQELLCEYPVREPEGSPRDPTAENQRDPPSAPSSRVASVSTFRDVRLLSNTSCRMCQPHQLFLGRTRVPTAEDRPLFPSRRSGPGREKQ